VSGDSDGESRVPVAGRARYQFRRGSEAAGARISRSLGEPALFAIMLSSAVAALYVSLGVVSGKALGLTPIVFLLAGLFLVVTMATYIEGTSLHRERGGASTLARYAFDEFWSFIAGWAILLDYLIAMSIGALAVSEYITVFWEKTDSGIVEVLVVAAVLLLVAMTNVRGLSADRLGMVLRLSLMNIALLVLISVIAFAQSFDAGAILDTIDIGKTPTWEDAIFATGVATFAMIGIEAASGLAGEVRVGRRGLRRFAEVSSTAALILFVAVSTAALMAVPVVNGSTALGDQYLEAPMLGIPSSFDPTWLMDSFRYLVGGMAAAMLLVTINGLMLGLGRLAYSLTTNRQIPSAVGRLHEKRGTPYVAITLAAVIAFLLALSQDIDFLAGIFAFGAMLAFAIAHLSVIVLRFREPDRPTAFRVPFGVRVGKAVVPIPAVLGVMFATAAWVSVVLFHGGGRVIGGSWMAIGVVLYVVYRRGQGKTLTDRFTIPAEALRDTPDAEYGSILVPVFGAELDDDIIGTAGRLAAEQADEAEGGAVLEALYVFEIPMSLPIDARVPDEKVAAAKRVLARAKEVGEEYEGVEVATAMVRGRSIGQAIVSEARRRGVEAIILAAEEPARIGGGALLGGRGRTRDRFVGETTRYVVEKAPCKVILTVPPAGEEGTREGVRP
jgi:APA family basic amino acid/polyamine antiporter